MAMKIKSLSKLQDLIDADHIWRKRELITLKQEVRFTKNEVFARAGMALLCAHFEGFVREIANYYILYVSCQKENISDLKNNFVAIHASKTIKRCAETEKISAYNSFLNDFFDDFEQNTFSIKYSQDNPVIKTGGNPSSPVFKEIVLALGLDFTPYETKTNYIDTDLLKNRHEIVHGSKWVIQAEDYDDTLTQILEIMESFKQQVLHAACSKDYLKPAP